MGEGGGRGSFLWGERGCYVTDFLSCSSIEISERRSVGSLSE